MPPESSCDTAHARFGARQTFVRLQHLGELALDREVRIERGHRVLEDHRDAMTSNLLRLTLRHGQQVAATEHRLAARKERRWSLQEAHQRQARDRLARTAFADDTEHLAVTQLE
jgi:hypothetical protein